MTSFWYVASWKLTDVSEVFKLLPHSSRVAITLMLTVSIMRMKTLMTEAISTSGTQSIYTRLHGATSQTTVVSNNRFHLSFFKLNNAKIKRMKSKFSLFLLEPTSHAGQKNAEMLRIVATATRHKHSSSVSKPVVNLIHSHFPSRFLQRLEHGHGIVIIGLEQG
jgi:hypothetical protein